MPKRLLKDVICRCLAITGSLAPRHDFSVAAQQSCEEGLNACLEVLYCTSKLNKEFVDLYKPLFLKLRGKSQEIRIKLIKPKLLKTHFYNSHFNHVFYFDCFLFAPRNEV